MPTNGRSIELSASSAGIMRYLRIVTYFYGRLAPLHMVISSEQNQLYDAPLQSGQLVSASESK